MWDCLHSCVTLQILFHSDVMCWDNFGLDLELGTALDRLVDDFGWLCNHLVAVDTVSSRGVRMLTLSLLVLCFTFGRCYWFCTEVVLGQWWFNLVKGLSVRTQWKGRIWGLLTKFVKFVFNICRLWLDLKPCWIWWDASFERGSADSARHLVGYLDSDLLVSQFDFFWTLDWRWGIAVKC